MRFGFFTKLSDRFVPQRTLTHVAEVVELVLGAIILLYCIVATAGSVFALDLSMLFQDPSYLRQQLSNAYSIIIGIELIMMIASASVDAVVDVMLFAVSRQMIVEHSTPLENLLTIVSVALLFVVRKYLYISKIDSRHFLKGGQKPQKGSSEEQSGSAAGVSSPQP